MTPEERQRVSELFDRLAQLETSPRDADAEHVIASGLARAPHAAYALVQTVLVQDEALKRADARIRELSGAQQPQSGGFLESMRAALGGTRQTSVPSVRAASEQPDPRWNSGGAYAAATPAPGYAPAPVSGGSFLGTAAASAAGFIGGALLLNSIGSMFGHHGASTFADVPRDNSPWDAGAANSDLARDAGLNDMGGGQRAGLFGDSDDNDIGTVADAGDDFGGDFGGGDAA